MIDNNEVDEKIIAIASNDPSMNTYHSIDDLPKHIFAEIQHFFEVYKNLEGKTTMVNEILGPEAAIEAIAKAIENYDAVFKNY